MFYQVQLWMVICVLPTRPCYRTGGVLSILPICVAMTFSLQNWRCLCLCDICVFVCSFYNTVLRCYLCTQYSSVPLDRPVLLIYKPKKKRSLRTPTISRSYDLSLIHIFYSNLHRILLHRSSLDPSLSKYRI